MEGILCIVEILWPLGHLVCMQHTWTVQCCMYHSRIHACIFWLRVCLICLLILSQHAFFVVEQPRQSLLYGHFRWQWLQERVCWVTLLCQNGALHACMSQVLEACMLSLAPRYMNVACGWWSMDVHLQRDSFYAATGSIFAIWIWASFPKQNGFDWPQYKPPVFSSAEWDELGHA